MKWFCHVQQKAQHKGYRFAWPKYGNMFSSYVRGKLVHKIANKIDHSKIY